MYFSGKLCKFAISQNRFFFFKQKMTISRKISQKSKNRQGGQEVGPYICVSVHNHFLEIIDMQLALLLARRNAFHYQKISTNNFFSTKFFTTEFFTTQYISLPNFSPPSRFLRQM